MKIISFVVLFVFLALSDSRVHVKNQVRRSKTLKRVVKSQLATKIEFDFSVITESNQVQFVIGVFNAIAEQFKLAKE